MMNMNFGILIYKLKSLLKIFSMDSSENINIGINYLLISWGLMPGEYQNRIIKKTKFGLFNMLFVFILYLFTLIKWLILIFTPENSKLINYFGEFLQYFGPKVFVDFVCIFGTSNFIMLFLLFYYSSKYPEKMLFWLDHMQFDSKSRCFNKLSLSKFENEKLTKQFALSWFIINRINYFLSLITFIIVLVSFFLFKHNYYLSYFISIIGFSILIWYNATQWFGLTLILYNVIN